MLLCFVWFCQEMFHERARLSSTNEANTQRLMAALKDKETAIKVRIRSKTSCKIIWMVMSFYLLWRLLHEVLRRL